MPQVQAIRYHGKEDMRLERIAEQGELKEQEVRLEPAWCGICGTDVHEYLHGPVFPPSADKPNPLTNDVMPIIFGHEFSGTITEVHPTVASLKVGDRVAVEGLLTDDTCYACSPKRRNLCDKSAFLGLSTNPGGLCERIVVPAFTCHKLPEAVSLEVGALVEPLSVAWHAVTTSGIQSHHSAIVFGAGPIGLAVILCLRAKGVTCILASEPSKARHSQAQKLGATRCFNPMEEDVVTMAKKMCDGIGPNFSFDASGVQATLSSGLKAICKYGTHYNIALWGEDATVDMNELLFNGKIIKADLSYVPGDYDAVIEAIMNGKISSDELQYLVTKRIDMESTVDEGIKELVHFKDRHIKILIRVDKKECLTRDL